MEVFSIGVAFQYFREGAGTCRGPVDVRDAARWNAGVSERPGGSADKV